MKKHMMTLVSWLVLGVSLGSAMTWLATRTSPVEAVAKPAPNTTPAPAAAASASVAFQPPPRSAMPDGDFGKMVRLGEQIFEHPQAHAGAYVGNDMRCSSCHLDAGRLAGAAPMWAAYAAYPAYRSKNHRVNTFAERLRGCFRYSMNGKQPPLGSEVLVALESYAYWLSRGERVDAHLPGRGFPKLDKPARAPDFARGKAVYEQHCALCHGGNGEGQRAADGSMTFPPLWGPDSYNWGAGMASLKKAAPFIKANMPLGLGGSLTDQQAWDVALFVDSHERPQDPRFNGSVVETRKRFHDSPLATYGTTVNGHVLGSDSVPAGGRTRGDAKAGRRP